MATYKIYNHLGDLLEENLTEDAFQEIKDSGEWNLFAHDVDIFENWKTIHADNDDIENWRVYEIVGLEDEDVDISELEG